MRERIRFESEISNLALRERRYDHEVRPNAAVGHVAWAKSVLNTLSNASFPLDNKVDDQFRTSLAAFQTANGLEATAKLDFKTERTLLEKHALSNLTDADASKKVIIIQAKSRIEDWTAKAIIAEKKKHLILQQFRNPRTITSLVLHHMAYKARDKRGNYSNPEVYLGVGAHFCIMRDGRTMQHHPISRFIWHSNCTSPRSVGVEFEGNFPDINGKWWYPTDKKTGKKIRQNEDVPTQEQIEAGKFLLSYLRLVIGIKHVLVHRQSSEDRTNDPGPDIWFNVGEWGLANLGLSDGGKDFKCGTGSPIPDSWRKWNRLSKQEGVGSPTAKPVATPPSRPQPVTPSTSTKSVAIDSIVSNRFYADKLGWGEYVHQINDLLLPYSGLSNVSLGKQAFADALKEWQTRHGLGGDGILGPKTWAAIKGAINIRDGSTSVSPTKAASRPEKDPSNERIVDGIRFYRKKLGWAAYGKEKELKAKLKDLQSRKRLSITDNEIDYFFIVSIPESGGAINAINSWDSAYMSMGFFQFPAKFNKLQRVIKKAPEAFRKHGIELDPPRIYDLGGEKPIAIKGAAKISDLRSIDWAIKFYKAGLEDDVIIAQISVAREILNDLLKRFDPGNYLSRFKNSYPNLWAFIFEAHNSRPAVLQIALKNTIRIANSRNISSPTEFGSILISELTGATRNYYSRRAYDKDQLKNQRLKQETIKEELAKVGRIITKTGMTR